MSLQTRLAALITAVGTDIKALNTALATKDTVRRFNINQSADFEITGLDGEADVGYELTWAGRMSGSKEIYLRPNGDAVAAHYSGLYHNILRNAAGVVAANQNSLADAGIRMSDSGTAGNAYSTVGQVLIGAKSQAGAFGRPIRVASGAKVETTTFEAFIWDMQGWWIPSPNNTALNKLTFNFGTMTFTGHMTLRTI